MLVVLIVNILISLVCWTVAVRLLCCCPRLKMVSTAFEEAALSCEQLRLAPLLLAEQQLQLLQLRQLYQNQTGQVAQLWQLLQLCRWLTR
jgi:hypothetical protein